MGMWLHFAQQYNPTLEVVETLDEKEIQEEEIMGRDLLARKETKLPVSLKVSYSFA